MTKQRQWQLFGVFLLVVLFGAIALPSHYKTSLPDNAFGWLKGEKIQLGLDLQGGTQLKYRIDMSSVPMSDQETIVDGIISVIRKRVDKLGVAEPIIQSSKIGQSYFIIVELPGIKNIDEAIAAVGKTVQLEFKEKKTTYTEAELAEVRTYNESQKTKAGEALKRARKGEDFTNLVNEYSEGNALANAGITGLTKKSDMLPAFADPASGLEPDAVYKDIIDQADGYYILKLIEKKSEIESTTDDQGNPVNAEVEKLNIQLIRLAKKSEVPTEGWVETGLTGKQFKHAAVEYDQTLNFRVAIQFNDEGKQLFSDITTRNIQKPVAILLDSELISAPTVQEAITDGEAVITGRFTQEEATSLAMNLNTGAIPAPIILIGQSNIGATLGQNALDQGIKAGIIGFIVLALFLIAYYRLPGFIATLALCCYTIFILGLFKLLNVTLTLAGIAGVILSVGKAVDANVLIFERFKEEVKAGKTIMHAIETGFKRAWSSIRDSNLSSLITCAILFIFGTGLIKGFAVTLAIGILVSMFSAINITKLILMYFVTPRLTKTVRLWGVNPKHVGTIQDIHEETRAERRRNK